MEIDHTSIQSELARISVSRCFRSSKSLLRFLHYIVNETLDGNTHNLTQHAIAVQGLGKHDSFDEIDNPLVRVQAGRLRKQLADYYRTEGRFNDPCIELPVGSYQPIFHQHLSMAAKTTFCLSQGPTVVCIPRNFIADTTTGWSLISRMTRDYVIALIQFSFCQIKFADETPWQQANWPQDAWLNYNADFALFFDLHTEKQGYSLKCSLVHRQNNQIVWAHSFPLTAIPSESATLTPIFKRIAHDTIGAERGIAQDYWVRQLLVAGNPIASHHQVVVAYRQYGWNISLETFRRSLRICEQRLEKFPHDVLALIIYADHCRAEYVLKYHEITSLYTSTAHTVDALLQLAPGKAYSHLFHAIYCLFIEDHDACRAALEQAQAINPLDTHLNIISGLCYIGLGDWKMGIQFIQDSINISTNHPDWYHIPVCLYHYHEGRYLTAIQEAKRIKLKHLWAPMLRAALYQA